MIGTLRVLAVIPARGGSKGIPRKNLALLGGRPLVAWTIDAALRSDHVDHVIVSTDDDDIAEAATTCGATVPFRRPADLATDLAPSAAVVRHAVEHVGGPFDIVVTLQPTSPLRPPDLVDRGVARLIETRAASCVSLARLKHDPSWLFFVDDGDHTMRAAFPGPLTSRRQDARAIFGLDGAFYATRVADLMASGSLLAPPCVAIVNDGRMLDIDDADDLLIAQALVRGA